MDQSSDLRTKPPWNNPGPALRVGFDPARGDYIILAPGGHIIAATTNLEEVGRLIRHESDYGYGSVELLLTGRHPDSTYTYHGNKSLARPSPGGAKARVPRVGRGLVNISLEDLDL